MPPIVHYCGQGSQEWIDLRLGIPTSSQFDRILTAGGKLSRSADKYAFELLAELITGRANQGPNLAIMQRGHDLEEHAVRSYEFIHGVETEPVGFVSSQCGRYGSSPDRFVSVNGCVEIKCPSPGIHVAYMLLDTAEEDYKPQLQGQLMVSERDYVDIVSYHPEMPLAVVRVERLEGYISTLRDAVEEFCDRLEKMRQVLVDRGYWSPPDPAPPKTEGKDSTWFDITEADLEAIFNKAQ